LFAFSAFSGKAKLGERLLRTANAGINARFSGLELRTRWPVFHTTHPTQGNRLI
jgi:hypothetical protein